MFKVFKEKKEGITLLKIRNYRTKVTETKSEVKKDRLEILENRKKVLEMQNFILLGRTNELEDSAKEFTQCGTGRQRNKKI